MRIEKELDRIIRRIVGTEYKHCPELWKTVKTRIAENQEGFIAELKREWKQEKWSSS